MAAGERESSSKSARVVDAEKVFGSLKPKRSNGNRSRPKTTVCQPKPSKRAKRVQDVPTSVHVGAQETQAVKESLRECALGVGGRSGASRASTCARGKVCKRSGGVPSL